MTLEEKAKLKAELADLSVEALENYRKVFVRMVAAIPLYHWAGVLPVIDELLEEQDEQPEEDDV